MLSSHRHGRFWTYMQRLGNWHMQSLDLLPRWRHPLVGFLAGFLLVGLGLSIGLVERQLLLPFSFPGVPLLFAVVLVALLWGVTPAVFTMLLSLLVLDYWYIPPSGTIGAYGLSGMLQLFTFASAGIFIALLAKQREIARMRALIAEREAVLRANQLEKTLAYTVAGQKALILARAQLLREHAEAQASTQALREAHTHMETSLSIICHELKTPLTIMRGSLQLAEHKVKRLVSTEAIHPDEMRRFAPIMALLERARSQVGIQNRLVDDLLDASRIQARTLQLLMAPCNLVSLVQQAVEDQRQIVPARTIDLEMAVENDLPVYGDADRLVQVISNFLTNALKYSPADRPVAVSLRTSGEMAHVLVRDQGPGLPSTEHERVWERFYRARGVEVQSGSGGGLGVGLYICRTIIERHGGQVGVDSQPGEGSTFWFTIPLASHSSLDEKSESAEE